MVRDENEDDPVEFVREHARETHDSELSAADIGGTWKTV